MEDSCDLIIEDDNNISIHIDYLTCVIPLINKLDKDIPANQVCNAIINDLVQYIGFNICELRESEFKDKNYDKCLMLGEHIKFSFFGEFTRRKININNDDGTISTYNVETLKIEMSGQACREFEERSNISFWDFCVYLNSLDGRFSRLDLAADDKGGLLKIEWLKDKLVDKKEFTTRFRTSPGKEDPFTPYGTLGNGYSILFGGRSSTTALMIYDKKLERVYRNDSYLGRYWTRWELRFLHEKADYAVDNFIEHGVEGMGDFYFENLCYMITLRDPLIDGKPTKNSQKSMWDVNPLWLKFTNSIKGVPLTISKSRNLSVESKMSWRDYSLSRMHFLLDFAGSYNDKNEYMFNVVPRIVHELKQELKVLENDKFKSSDLAMVNAYRLSKDKDAKLLTVYDVQKYSEEIKISIKKLESYFTYPF